MILKLVIVDDEPMAIENLLLLLNTLHFDIEVVGSATNVIDAVKLIRNNKPDFVLLDVNMPSGSGFDVLDLLGEINFEIIFATAHNQYAIEAIKRNALDYLLKPFNSEELKQAIQKVVEKREKHANVKTKLFLPTVNSIELIEYESIIYIEASSNYCFIYIENGEKILASKTLKSISKLIDFNYFIRCHRSYIVNFKKVKRYVKDDGGFLELKNGNMIPISNSNKEHVLSRLNLI